MKYLLIVEDVADAQGCVSLLSHLAKHARYSIDFQVLTVVELEDLVDCPDDQNPQTLSSHVQLIAGQRFAAIRQATRQHMIETTFHVRTGDLEDAVLEAADHIGPDIVMLARRGGARLEDLFQGAQSQLIAASCSCPVMIVPTAYAPEAV